MDRNMHSPDEIVSILVKTIGAKKSKIKIPNALVLGFFAGVFIGFGAMLATLVGHDSSEYVGVGLSKLLTGLVFSVGLVLVMVVGAELFTGNTMMIGSVISKKASWKRMLLMWLVVYFANFVGALFLAYLYYHSESWKGNNMEIGIKAIGIANAKVSQDFVVMFIRGILANWLVCLGVMMAISAKDIAGKVLGIVPPIATFVALGFEHSIANMYFIPMGIFLKGSEVAGESGLDLSNLTWKSFFIDNLIPVTFGNIIGGAFFVMILYWYAYSYGKNSKK